jgi:hypothetical protein
MEGFLKALALILFIFGSSVPAFAQSKSELKRTPEVDPVEGVKLGRTIVAELLAQGPGENATNRGVMTTRQPDIKPREVPIRFEIFRSKGNWSSVYEAAPPGQTPVKLTVMHAEGKPNRYLLNQSSTNGPSAARELSGNQTMTPFAGSDFWVADLGLEFFHWPNQRLVKREMRRSRSCNVVESVNPQPAKGAYSRVVCWLMEGGGIVHADAYDAKNELIKQFDPKGVTKIHGEYQLEGMEIRNRQAATRTRIDFDLER